MHLRLQNCTISEIVAGSYDGVYAGPYSYQGTTYYPYLEINGGSITARDCAVELAYGRQRLGSNCIIKNVDLTSTSGYYAPALWLCGPPSYVTVGASGNPVDIVAAVRGIRVRNISPSISYCDIRHGYIGIQLVDAAPILNRCYVDGSDGQGTAVGDTGISLAGLSDPSLSYCWLWGSRFAEIGMHTREGDSPDIEMIEGDNGIHTDQGYDNDDDPVPGTANWAIRANFTPSPAIYVSANWWGDASPTYSDIFYPSNGFIENSPENYPPPFSRPKPGRGTRSPDVALYAAARHAEIAGDHLTALTAYQEVLSEYPESTTRGHCLHRIDAVMTHLGTPEDAFRDFFQNFVDGTGVPGDMKKKAERILELSLRRYGHRDQLVAIYRARANAPAATATDWLRLWLETAEYARETEDVPLLQEATHAAEAIDENSLEARCAREMLERVLFVQSMLRSNGKVSRPAGASATLSARPNPFNSTTTITYRIDAAEMVRLTVYNLAGQRLRELAYGEMQAGTYTIGWDGDDGMGQAMASGVYLLRMSTAEQTLTRRVTLLR